MQPPSAEYVLGGTETELNRLRAQAGEHDATASWLLQTIGIRQGARVLDVGCGPIGILGLLSEAVGPAGSVVGLEREARFVTLARSEIARRGLTNVEIVEADALASGLERDSFDLVHARLVLVNVPERAQLIKEMLAMTAPGGILASEEIDNVSWLCEPPHESWTALVDAFHQVFRAGRGDPFLGRKLPSMYLKAGLEDVQSRIHVDLPVKGQYRRTHLVSLVDSVRDKIIASGAMSEAVLDAHREALLTHLDDPGTVVIDKLLVQCWGRKPAA